MPRDPGAKCRGASVKELRAWLRSSSGYKGVRHVDLATCRVYDNSDLGAINRRFPTRGDSLSQIGTLVRFEVVPPRSLHFPALAIVDGSWLYPGKPTDRFAMAWADPGLLATWICKRVGVTGAQLRKLRPYLKRHGYSADKCFDWQKFDREGYLRDIRRKAL